jgi:hypothetical protein
LWDVDIGHANLLNRIVRISGVKLVSWGIH